MTKPKITGYVAQVTLDIKGDKTDVSNLMNATGPSPDPKDVGNFLVAAYKESLWCSADIADYMDILKIDQSGSKFAAGIFTTKIKVSVKISLSAADRMCQDGFIAGTHRDQVLGGIKRAVHSAMYNDPDVSYAIDPDHPRVADRGNNIEPIRY